MFGDDQDPTVITERVGFRAGFGRAREGAASWQERLGGHETDNEGKGFDELRKEREKRAVQLI